MQSRWNAEERCKRACCCSRTMPLSTQRRWQWLKAKLWSPSSGIKLYRADGQQQSLVRVSAWLCCGENLYNKPPGGVGYRWTELFDSGTPVDTIYIYLDFAKQGIWFCTAPTATTQVRILWGWITRVGMDQRFLVGRRQRVGCVWMVPTQTGQMWLVVFLRVVSWDPCSL